MKRSNLKDVVPTPFNTYAIFYSILLFKRKIRVHLFPRDRANYEPKH